MFYLVYPENLVHPVQHDRRTLRRSVKHYPYTNPEIVLRAIKQSRRVVVELNNSHINSIARTDVDTSTKRSGKSCFGNREVGTRARRDRDTNIGTEIHAIASVRGAHKRMSERFECRLRSVVFDLDASEKVIETRVDVDDSRWATRDRKILALEVPGKIGLQSKISSQISGSRHFESVKALTFVDDILQCRIVVADAGIDAVMRIAAKELKFFVITRLSGGD